MPDRERMRDAAFPANIPADWNGAVGGYYGGPREFRQWEPAEWARFRKHRKLPIWVAGFEGKAEGEQAVAALKALHVPRGAYTALDLETRVDKTYVEHFGQVLQAAGYKVWVYGSAGTVFENPCLNGYWVADYAGKGPYMYPHRHVRATQYAEGNEFDSSTVRAWTYFQGTWWR